MNNALNNAAALCIAAVERDTGLGKDTLRVWERRYGFPKPDRDAKGERLYPADQVEKLRIIRCLLDRGQRPSKVVGASTEDLRAMLETPDEPGPADPPSGGSDVLQYVRLGRTVELAVSLRQALLRQGLQRFVTETVAPLNEEVGAAWMRGEIQISDEHAYTEQMQNVLRGAIGSFGPAGERPRVLLSTLPGEDHVLGLLMVEATLVSEGAACLSLGTRTPMADLCRAAVAGDAKTAREIHFKLLSLNKLLFAEPNPVPVKWAMQRLGLCGGTLRLPMVPMTDALMPGLEAAMREAGLL